MKKRLFILDTDTGLDDALMLIAAMSIKELEILGITSVNGNVSEQYTCHNNLALMTFLNKKFLFVMALLPRFIGQEILMLKVLYMVILAWAISSLEK